MVTSELSAIGTAVARCPSFELARAAFRRFDQAAVHWRDTEDASKSSPHAIHLRAPVGQGYHPAGVCAEEGSLDSRFAAFAPILGSCPANPLNCRPRLRDMRAFHAEKSPIKRDEIASRQIHVLRQYQGKSERPIKLHQVKEMFEEMRDQA